MSSPHARFATWQIDDEPPPELVRQSANEVYRARRDGQVVYLRVIPDSHRSAGEVEAELSWMRALAAAGVRVARPIPSTSGRLVEAGLTMAGEAASLACFEAAPGRLACKPEDYRAPVIDSWAALLADLHRPARQPPPAVDRGRPRWDQDRVFQMAREAGDARTAPAQTALRALVGWMQGLDRGPGAFGLTHADLHLGNLTVDADGQVTAFDFDDSCQHWFVHDLAVAVTSIRKADWEYPGRFDAAAVERRFVERYFAAGVLDGGWRARLEAFVAYRVALSACWASRAAELGQLDAEMQAWFGRSLPWWLRQLHEGRDEIDRAMATDDC
jgi:Ser/Thr protein kinase RdoA (MazF antagonist)